jgi:hypothetical protein
VRLDLFDIMGIIAALLSLVIGLVAWIAAG